MNYAIIENGIVINLIVGLPEGLEGIACGDLEVRIGDLYANGSFTRNGQPVTSPAIREVALQTLVSTLDIALVNLEYQNVLLTLGVTSVSGI